MFNDIVNKYKNSGVNLGTPEWGQKGRTLYLYAIGNVSTSGTVPVKIFALNPFNTNILSVLKKINNFNPIEGLNGLVYYPRVLKDIIEVTKLGAIDVTEDIYKLLQNEDRLAYKNIILNMDFKYGYIYLKAIKGSINDNKEFSIVPEGVEVWSFDGYYVPTSYKLICYLSGYSCGLGDYYFGLNESHNGREIKNILQVRML